MNTLDSRLIFYFSGSQVTGHTVGTYPYYLYRYNLSGTTDTIFVGNFFYDGSATSVTFDMTDIIRSDGFVIKDDDFEDVYTMSNKLINKYQLKVYWSAHVSVSTSARWIGKFYSYPNKDIAPYSNWIISDPNHFTYKKYVIPMLQSYVPDAASYNNGESLLLPHYPMYNDEQYQADNNCPFGLSLKFGDEVSSTTLAFEVGPMRFDDISYNILTHNIQKNGPSCTYISNVGNVADYRGIVPTSDGYAYITDRQYVIDVSDVGQTEGVKCFMRYPSQDRSSSYQYRYAFAYIASGDNKWCGDLTPNDLTTVTTSWIIYSNVEYPTTGQGVNELYNADGSTLYIVGDDAAWIYTYQTKVAVFDVCPKRYYLFWQDRYGSFQCQPFNDYANYSESFNRTEIQDYQNRRRNVNIQVQSKWKLNSGWIKEELYPYYESIYTSQVLILFDTKQNERFSVLVSGDYEEKTYKNQKKLINMNLELTENKKQEFIY